MNTEERIISEKIKHHDKALEELEQTS